MAKPYELYREPIQVAQGYNLNAYKRDGLILNVSPIQEYVRMAVSGIADNQTAVFDLDSYGLDIMPCYLYADFLGATGNVTLSVFYFGNEALNYSIPGAEAELGYALPQIPITHTKGQIRIHTTRACNNIWVSAKQCAVLENIAQSYFI